jgi:uncharacterized protein (DUF488 family)
VTTLLTVGHGTLDRESFTELLHGAGVTTLVDVRRFPGSRRHPHFASDAMQGWLSDASVAYRWEERLGGRRHLTKEERGADPWWQVEAFGAYAAYTRTDEFREAFAELLAGCASASGATAVMCSESLWWRCHRRLISDVAVLLHQLPVLHLAHTGRLSPHAPAAGARVTPDGLRYDAP